MKKFVIWIVAPILVIIAFSLYFGLFGLKGRDLYHDVFVAAPVTFDTPSPSIPILMMPKPNETITGPLVIKGFVSKSWTFEGQFLVRLLDANRRTILQDRVPVEWDNENQKDTLYFVESYNYHTTAKSGFLVLENDNPSGLSENQKSFEIPVKFSPPPPGTVYLFFYHPEEDKKISDLVACQVHLPVTRYLGQSKTPIKDTIELLLKGPTADEIKAGYASEFPAHPDFYLKSLNLKNGVLTMEFPNVGGFTEGGSCAMGIRVGQITKTVLQFPEVKSFKYTPESLWQP